MHFLSPSAGFDRVLPPLISAKMVSLSLKCDLGYPFTALLIPLKPLVAAAVGGDNPLSKRLKNGHGSAIHQP